VTNNVRKPPIDQVLETLIYAPMGAALYLRDAFPMIRVLLVNRGRAAVEHRQHQVAGTVRQYRSAGPVAFRTPRKH